jgi:TPR repeat protein/chaperone required for assembly of F1-ATPase
MPEAERYQQYEVLRRGDGSLWELGRGAMGITYKAYDTNLHCTVALKVINSAYLGNDTARQRFLREARAAAALRHPNVASVFNLGTDQDNYFYVMEFIDGETVEACVKRKGRLEPAEALNTTLQVARALAAAAKVRLVHRDLKPANLMLVEQDGESVVKVIDFGLAKSAKDAGEDTAALTVGGFVGTPHFASPEQVEEGDLDIRSDIYSLGATLYFMLAGKAPFSGSVAQVMTQHLYKPINIEPLTGVLPCVVSLIQRMLEKDRNQRYQTPRELQNAIVTCLEEIRGHSTRVAPQPAEEPPQALSPETLLAQTYRLIEELRESPQGRRFLAEDVRQKCPVCLLILRQELVSDPHWFMSLQAAIDRLRTAPHPMLRAIYSLERVGGYSILAEEHLVGSSLQDLLRSRSVLSAPEVVRLLNLLAPLADHASANHLEHVELTLLGIHLVIRQSTAGEIQPDLLQRPLTAWEHFETKVNAINFSFALTQAGTLTGMETRVHGALGGGPRDSYVRSLALLAYELLGGPRARVEATGRYNPIAALTRDGNAVLRGGLIDEYSSAAELTARLAAAAGIRESTVPVAERKATVASSTAHVTSRAEPVPTSTAHASSSVEGVTPEPASRITPSEVSTDVPSKRIFLGSVWQLILVIGFIAAIGAGGYLIYLGLHQNQEIVAPSPELDTLSVQSDPPGASILLDGKAPQSPNTFTHVPYGKHQLTATLDNYEPLKQDLEVRRGMAPEIRLQLKPIQEVASLSVQSDPPGAAILLDGKPPQSPNTFTHVPYGKHQLTATLDNYEPLKQDIDVRRGMAPKLELKLTPIQEIGSLSVQSDPPGASILLDGKPPQGPANTFTRVPFGTHQLTATLDDYEPLKQNIEVRKGMTPKIALKLTPIQEIGSLSVQSDPPGASILLDGKPPQGPSNTFTRVPFGTHQLTATLDNYEPIKQDIEVRRGMASEIRLQLKPIREIASLSVQTDPPGASILLDGKPPQGPSNTFTRVPFGAHQLTAALDNYEPIKQDIEVRRGMAPEIRLQLKPIQEIGSLSVQSDPPGATILLDGKPPQGPANTFTRVPFGTHQLAATLDNYESIKQDIEVRRGMAPEIRLQLKPIQEIASLAIQSDPPGASILLDGKRPQGPSNTFTRVPFGTHQLTATLDNYEPIKQDIEVRRGMAPEINLKLNKKPDPVAGLLADAKKYGEGTPQQLAAYVRLVQYSTNSGAPNSAGYSKELGQIIERLRTKVPSVTKDEFNFSYKESTKDAADLDILPAVVWLADNEKGRESFNLFLRAANLGDSYAMMKVGRLYLRKGTSNDDEEGFRWLNRAYNAPNRNLEAGAFMADCYLSGKGAKLDVEKGEEMVMRLANQEVVPAMTLAGRLLQIKAEDAKRLAAENNASAQLRKQLDVRANEWDRQAREWWERAVEKGDWTASARLAQYYEKGLGGVKKNEEEAEKRYKEGVENGSALSMFFYGQFLLEKRPDQRGEAETLISQAAAAGLPAAIKWCKENKINFTEARSDDER